MSLFHLCRRAHRKQEAIPPMVVGNVSGKFISADNSCNGRGVKSLSTAEKELHGHREEQRSWNRFNGFQDTFEIINPIFLVAKRRRDQNRFVTSSYGDRRGGISTFPLRFLQARRIDYVGNKKNDPHRDRTHRIVTMRD